MSLCFHSSWTDSHCMLFFAYLGFIKHREEHPLNPAPTNLDLWQFLDRTVQVKQKPGEVPPMSFYWTCYLSPLWCCCFSSHIEIGLKADPWRLALVIHHPREIMFAGANRFSSKLPVYVCGTKRDLKCKVSWLPCASSCNIYIATTFVVKPEQYTNVKITHLNEQTI